MGYPVNLEVSGRPVLVVGGGAVAARKIAALVETGAAVTVIAPSFCDPVSDLAREGRLRAVCRDFEEGDARGAFLVIGATDDDAVNRRVARDARTWGALVNIVDRPALCTFTVPAVVRRGRLSVAVATDGRCPSLARALRERLEGEFGPEYAAVVERLGDVRQSLISAGWASARINTAVATLLASGFVDAVAAGDEARVVGLIEKAVGDAGGGAGGEG